MPQLFFSVIFLVVGAVLGVPCMFRAARGLRRAVVGETGYVVGGCRSIVEGRIIIFAAGFFPRISSMLFWIDCAYVPPSASASFLREAGTLSAMW